MANNGECGASFQWRCPCGRAREYYGVCRYVSKVSADHPKVAAKRDNKCQQEDNGKKEEIPGTSMQQQRGTPMDDQQPLSEEKTQPASQSSVVSDGDNPRIDYPTEWLRHTAEVCIPVAHKESPYSIAPLPLDAAIVFQRAEHVFYFSLLDSEKAALFELWPVQKE